MSGLERMRAVGRQNLAAGRAMLSARRAERTNRLCDLIADGMPVKRAAVEIGVSETAAHNMLRDVRAKYEQAQ